MLTKIISGGQTGADRAALDFAIAHGIPHGGWCPRGRLAEDGKLDQRYQLSETPGADFNQRTEWNVRDSDATAIFSVAPELTGGSSKTTDFSRKHQKPCLLLSREADGRTAAKRLAEFLITYQARILNVAGPRQSEEPEVGKFVQNVLKGAYARAMS